MSHLLSADTDRCSRWEIPSQLHQLVQRARSHPAASNDRRPFPELRSHNLLAWLTFLSRDNPTLHYYQGLHEVTHFFLFIMECGELEEEVRDLLEPGRSAGRLRLSFEIDGTKKDAVPVLPVAKAGMLVRGALGTLWREHLRLWATKTMDATMAILRGFHYIIRKERRSFAVYLEHAGLGPSAHFALAPLITWGLHQSSSDCYSRERGANASVASGDGYRDRVVVDRLMHLWWYFLIMDLPSDSPERHQAFLTVECCDGVVKGNIRPLWWLLAVFLQSEKECKREIDRECEAAFGYPLPRIEGGSASKDSSTMMEYYGVAFNVMSRWIPCWLRAHPEQGVTAVLSSISSAKHLSSLYHGRLENYIRRLQQ
jgi:hypothetical protein